MLGEAIMITFAGYGIQIERQNETQESLEIYISVPERSSQLDAENREMSGLHLARRYKRILTEMGVKRLTVKARIRKEEYWTDEMAKNAELNMRRQIYGSQY